MKFFHLERDYFRHKSEYLAALEKVLDSGSYLEGEQLQKFEQKFADYIGAKYVIALGSGSDALTMALMVANIGQGDEVITTNYAPAVHLYAIIRSGAKPIFIDVDPHTAMMDIKKIETAITPYTRAIIPFHFHGYCDDIEKILDIANKHRLIVIENAWQAVGTYFNNKHVGTFGKLGVFSFYPTTTLGAFGDCGAIATNDKAIYETLTKIRHSEHFHVNLARKTFVSRMTEIQAAILNIKMKYLKDLVYRRQRIANKIIEQLPYIDYIKPRKGCIPNYYILSFTVKEREKMRDNLRKQGLNLNVYYSYVLNKLDKTNILFYKDYPVSQQFAKTILSLPPCGELSNFEVEKLINIIKSFYE